MRRNRATAAMNQGDENRLASFPSIEAAEYSESSEIGNLRGNPESTIVSKQTIHVDWRGCEVPARSLPRASEPERN